MNIRWAGQKSPSAPHPKDECKVWLKIARNKTTSVTLCGQRFSRKTVASPPGTSSGEDSATSGNRKRAPNFHSCGWLPPHLLSLSSPPPPLLLPPFTKMSQNHPTVTSQREKVEIGNERNGKKREKWGPHPSHPPGPPTSPPSDSVSLDLNFLPATKRQLSLTFFTCDEKPLFYQHFDIEAQTLVKVGLA